MQEYKRLPAVAHFTAVKLDEEDEQVTDTNFGTVQLQFEAAQLAKHAQSWPSRRLSSMVAIANVDLQ